MSNDFCKKGFFCVKDGTIFLVELMIEKALPGQTAQWVYIVHMRDFLSTMKNCSLI